VANLQPPNECWGVSDLRDVLGLNRALNERMSDQADLIRYHADPPVVFKGVAEHSDLAARPGTSPAGDRDSGLGGPPFPEAGSDSAPAGHLQREGRSEGNSGRPLRFCRTERACPCTCLGDKSGAVSGVPFRVTVVL
jgi:hypothetical protein